MYFYCFLLTAFTTLSSVVTEVIFFWRPVTFNNISFYSDWVVITSSHSFTSWISNQPGSSTRCAFSCCIWWLELFRPLSFIRKEATWPKLFSSLLKYFSFIQQRRFTLLSRPAFYLISLSYFFLISSIAFVFSKAIVLRFRMLSFAYPWLATILDSSLVISLFFFLHDLDLI